jgi:hypothetical protein
VTPDASLGIAFGQTRYVFFGGPFVAVSNVEVDCEELAFVRQSYEQGSQPTTDEMQLLQFAYASGAVEEGNRSIDISASVNATVVKSGEGGFEFTRAQSGTIQVDALVEEESAEGTFDTVTFDDGGSVSGEFSAVWCRNLRDR